MQRKTAILGSPPPMRGKAIYFPDSLVQDRITPAYAGKRDSCSGVEFDGKDHPRLCGEKFNARERYDLP